MSPEQMDKLLENAGAEAGRRGPHHASSSRAEQQAPGTGGGTGNGQQGQVRSHRQIARFSRLQDAEGSAGLARQIELRARTIRATWRRASRPVGSSKQYEFGDTLNLDISETLFSAMRREGVKVPLESGVLGSARASVRVPELLRDGADARLQPQHDPVRRGSVHAGEEGGAGAGASDPDAVSGRQPALRAVP